LQAGTVLADSTSICLIFFAPVFYPLDELPKAMQYATSLLPTTYAADGIAKSLSGKGGAGMDMLALLLFSFVALFTAIRSLRWRDL
jgi:ABC-type multidrug transport system permease subunit